METREFKSGLKYREKVYINSKTKISPWFKRKSDANRWKNRELSERDRNKALGITQAENITFNVFSKRFIQSKQHLSKGSIRSYMGTVKNRLIPYFGKMMLRDIRPHQVEEFKFNLQVTKELSKSRINGILRVLKMLFNYANELDLIYSSPARNLKLFKIETREADYWSLYECSSFLTQTKSDSYFQLYLIALNTGMRLGELLGLKWDSVDLKESRVKVRRTMTRDGLQETTKGKKDRSIPMNNTVKECLTEMYNNRRSFEFVFLCPKGKPVSYEHFTYRVFNKCLLKLNMRKIKFHGLRTTFASNFCMQGGDIFTLSKILGHSSVDITQKRYAFLSDHFLREEMGKFEISIESSTYLAPRNVEPIKSLKKTIC